MNAKPNNQTVTDGMSLSQIRDDFACGKLSAIDAVESCFANIEQKRHLNVFITEAKDDALRSASESEERRAKGATKPLDGIPIAVKDNFCTG